MYLSLSCIYLAPNISPEDYSRGIQCLSNLYKSEGLHLTVGDFNLPKIDWQTLTSPNEAKCTSLLEFCLTHGINQLVTQPTRDMNILDLVLTDDSQLISTLTVAEPFSTSDHNMITFNICNNSVHSGSDTGIESVREVFNWHGGMWDDFALYCSSQDWISLLSNVRSADECWEVFCCIMNAGVHEFIPQFKCKNGARPKIDKALRKLNNKKAKLWKNKCSAPTQLNKERYKDSANAVKRYLYNRAIDYEETIIQSNDTNKFFKYMKKSRIHSSGIAPLLLNSGEFAAESMDEANCLNDHFAKMCTIDDGSYPKYGRPHLWINLMKSSI